MTSYVLYSVIADSSLREAVQETLSDVYETVVFDSISKVIEAMSEKQPDVLLCEQALLEPDQALGLATLKTASHGCRILTMGSSRSIEKQVAALKFGSRGYFDISLPIATLNPAIAGILRGEIWVERHIISELIDELVDIPEVNDEQRQLVDSLSPKELEVAKLVSHGATNKMIAHQLSITERTVKAHLTATYQKLKISDRLALAIFFKDLK